MTRAGFIGLSLAAFAFLYAVQWRVYRPVIERDLVQRTRKALQERAIPVTSTLFSGRDGEIRLSLPANSSSTIREAAEVARRVHGVRVARVTALEKMGVPASTPKQMASLRVERTGENVRLMGYVGFEKTRAFFQQEAERAFSGFAITNEIEVSATVEEPEYVRPVAALIGLLLRTAPLGSIELAGRTVRLSGDVPQESERSALEKQAREVLPRGLDLVCDLKAARTVASPSVADSVKATGDFGKEVEATHVLFAFDSAQLTPEALFLIEPLLELVKERPQTRLQILGHTDSVGTDAYNMALSRRRARAVARVFEEQGLKGHFNVRALGERRPVASNATHAGRAKNRRVQFQVLEMGE